MTKGLMPDHQVMDFLGASALASLIRSHDWASTPLGPLESWPQSLKTTTGLLIGSPVPMVLLWGPEGTMIYNAAYAVFAGGRHPHLLGSAVREGWPEIADFNDHVMKRGLAGEALSFRDQGLNLDRGYGFETVFMDLNYSPVPDEAGYPGGVLAVVVETTERVTAEARARAERTRHRQMLQQMPGFAATLAGPDHQFDWTNDAYRTFWGREDLVGRTVREAFPEMLQQGLLTPLDDVFKSGARQVFRGMEIRVEGSSHSRFIDFVYEPIRDDAGEISGVFVGGYEVTEMHRSFEAVRENERELLLLADNIPLLVSFVGQDERYVFNNRAYHDWFDIAPDSLKGRSVQELVGDEAYALMHPRIARALAGERLSFEDRIPYRDLGPRDVAGDFVPRISTDGTVEGYYAILQDISDRRRSEARQATLLRLNEALQDLTDAGEIAHASAGVLADALGVTRAGYGVVDHETRTLSIDRDVHPDGLPSLCGRILFDDYGSFFGELEDGHVVAIDDVETDPRTRDRRSAFRQIGVAATVNVPLQEQGRTVALIYVGSPVARVWSEAEFTLMREVAVKVRAAIERARSDTALRLNEARLRFVDALTTATMSIDDADTFLSETTRKVGEYLQVSICAYAEVDPDQEGFSVRGDWAAAGSRSLRGRYRLSDLGSSAKADLAAGRPWVIDDVRATLAPDQIDRLGALGIAATVWMPLKRNGTLAALMIMHQTQPHRWTSNEVSLLREVTQRSWAQVERIDAETERRDRANELETVFEAVPAVIWLARDPAAAHIQGNAFARRLLRMEHADNLSRTPSDPAKAASGFRVLDREGMPIADPDLPVQRAARGEEVLNFEEEIVYDDGSSVFLIGNARPLFDAQGAPRGAVASFVDITDRKAAENRRTARISLERQLRNLSDPGDVASAAAELLARTLGASRAGYGVFDPDANAIMVEGDWMADGLESVKGLHAFDLYGTYASSLAAGDVVAIGDVLCDPRVPEGAEALVGLGSRAILDVPVVEGDRTVAQVFVHSATPRQWSDDEVALVRDFADRTRAVIARRAAEAELRASENNFRTLARSQRNHVWTADAQGNLDWFNDQVYAYGGVEKGKLDGSNWIEMVHPDDRPRVADRWAEAIASGAPYESEFRLRRADGTYRWHIVRAVTIADGSSDRVRWIGTNTDIDDQKAAIEAFAELNATLEDRVRARSNELSAAQEALRQSQKMEAVGQLTGGIAHDFNNLLAGISGALELLAKRLADGRLDGIERFIDAAQTSAQRAAALTQRLLAFSRRQTLDPRATDVNALIKDMEDLIRRSVGPTVQVRVTTAEDLWTIRIDRSQLENALLNLCINGRDAMAPHGGLLTIESLNCRIEEGEAITSELPAGPYVQICVTDTGTGMPPEVQARAFDPFFTTKPLGQGTGLGLSMIHGFVRQSGGYVEIQSEEGSGTTLCLYLPALPGAPLSGDLEPVLVIGEDGKGETVLIIDDEAAVRMLVAEVLTEAGYAVIEASDGPSGLEVLRSPQRIDLLVTDVGLPGGVNGRQVADAARVTRPGLKVLFITGYAETAAIGDGLVGAGMEVLTKPFAMGELTARVRSMIEVS